MNDALNPVGIRVGLKKMAEMMIPKGESLICPEGSRLAMWDDQAVYFEGLLSF